MKTIAFVTQKGGAGKTTLAATIAVAAMQAGENVIALDLDPQGSLAAWGDQHAQAGREAPAVDAVPADRVPQLPAILKALEGRGYTLALLDCPGVASTATTIAMQSADLSLVPARSDAPGYSGDAADYPGIATAVPICVESVPAHGAQLPGQRGGRGLVIHGLAR